MSEDSRRVRKPGGGSPCSPRSGRRARSDLSPFHVLVESADVDHLDAWIAAALLVVVVHRLEVEVTFRVEARVLLHPLPVGLFVVLGDLADEGHLDLVLGLHSESSQAVECEQLHHLDGLLSERAVLVFARDLAVEIEDQRFELVEVFRDDELIHLGIAGCSPHLPGERVLVVGVRIGSFHLSEHDPGKEAPDGVVQVVRVFP